MFGLSIHSRPTADDAVRYALQGHAEMTEEIGRLERMCADLQAQINEIGSQVIPDYKLK